MESFIFATMKVTAEIRSILIVPPKKCESSSHTAYLDAVSSPRGFRNPTGNPVTFVTRFGTSTLNLLRPSSYDQDSKSGGISETGLGSLYFFAHSSLGFSGLCDETCQRKR